MFRSLALVDRPAIEPAPPDGLRTVRGGWRATAAAVAALAAAACGSSAFAGGTVTVPVIDLGFEATDLATLLQGYLVPFLVGAISVGFAFWAVKRGVRWIKNMIG